MTRRWLAGAALGALLAFAPAVKPSSGQGLLNHGSGPIAIDADEGIEWRRDEKVYVATGNAKAVRGDVTVTAHRLIAYYRDRNPAKVADAKDSENAAMSTDIYRLVAETDVNIATPTQRAHGERGVYDVDRAVLVMTGQHLSLDTTQDHITARDSLEYWDERKIAVARGDGVMVRADRRVEGDVLTAHIQEDPKTNESHVSEVDGFGNLRVSTPAQIAQGGKGVYNLVTNIAYLVDNVRVTQGKNQINGDYGEVNLNTNVSRMLSGPSAGRPGQRVRSLIVPNQGEPPPDATASQSGTRGRR